MSHLPISTKLHEIQHLFYFESLLYLRPNQGDSKLSLKLISVIIGKKINFTSENLGDELLNIKKHSFLCSIKFSASLIYEIGQSINCRFITIVTASHDNKSALSQHSKTCGMISDPWICPRVRPKIKDGNVPLLGALPSSSLAPGQGGYSPLFLTVRRAGTLPTLRFCADNLSFV